MLIRIQYTAMLCATCSGCTVTQEGQSRNVILYLKFVTKKRLVKIWLNMSFSGWSGKIKKVNIPTPLVICHICKKVSMTGKNCKYQLCS